MTRSIDARWTPRQEDFDRFAELSGDSNPIHVDPDFSRRSRFGRTVAHGMLLYSRVHALIANAYPDRGHALQTLMFPNPAYADEELDLAVDEEAGGRLAITLARADDGAIVLQGACQLEDTP